jgi:hypothetical protein
MMIFSSQRRSPTVVPVADVVEVEGDDGDVPLVGMRNGGGGKGFLANGTQPIAAARANGSHAATLAIFDY